MARHPEAKPSPFEKLLEARRARNSQTSEQSDVSTANLIGQPDGLPLPPPKLAKSHDPAFAKFTTYIRKTTHRAAKLRAVSEGRELSEVVEELLLRWAGEKP